MPTKRRRHAITETPPVEAALNDLRRALGTDRVDLGELVVLGVGVKLGKMRAEEERKAELRKQLADRVRRGDSGIDIAAAEEVRRTGWVREPWVREP